MPVAKKPASKTPPERSSAKKPAASERDTLVARIAGALGVSAEEAELRALRELDARLTPPKRPEPKQEWTESAAALPKRLYLLLDGRGLDGRGMPIEVIDLPCTLGSGKRNSIWINSPQIETRHLQITQDGNDWVAEDLDTEHGTFLEGKRVKRAVLRGGEELRLAGYLRLRAELR